MKCFYIQRFGYNSYDIVQLHAHTPFDPKCKFSNFSMIDLIERKILSYHFKFCCKIKKMTGDNVFHLSRRFWHPRVKFFCLIFFLVLWKDGKCPNLQKKMVKVTWRSGSPWSSRSILKVIFYCLVGVPKKGLWSP